MGATDFKDKFSAIAAWFAPMGRSYDKPIDGKAGLKAINLSRSC
jgi:hypothetical protein